MSIFKCKMCGGTLDIAEGATVGVCDSCGTKQTLPRAADDLTANLFNRANNLRLKREFDKAAALYEKIVEQDDANAEAHWGIVLCRYGIEYVEDPATKKRVPTVNRAQVTSLFDDDNYKSALRYADGYQRELYKKEANAINEIQKLGETEAKAAVMETVVVRAAANASPLLKRAFMFLEDGDWERADEFCEQVLNQDPENAEAYLGKLMAELRVRQRMELENCEKPFDGSSNYKRAVRFGDAAFSETIKNLNKACCYNSALRTMNTANSEENYKTAAETFKELSGFQNADTLARQCIEKAEERRIAAEKAAKKRKKIIAIITPIVVVCIAFLIVLTMVIIPTARKKSFIEKYGQDIYDRFGLVEKGKSIKFGSYEQDNNISNGKEEIEWLVLEVEDDKALLISKCALDCQQFTTSYRNEIWETCSLRKWLNRTFINDAFSSDDQYMIQITNVTGDKNWSYSDTADKVFLLDITEVNEYLISDEAKKCVPTDYAIAQGAYTSSSYSVGGKAACWWWLRSPGGDYSGSVAYVRNDGSVGSIDSRNIGAVRPALWINLGS